MESQTRSAPKGRQQMGETGFCKNLRVSAVSCENLRFPAKILRKSAPKSLDLQSEPKISENLPKSAFRVRFLPFAVSLLARPDKPSLLNGRLENCRIGGCKALRQPFCQPLSSPLFPWTPGTRLETRVNGPCGSACCGLVCWSPCGSPMWVANFAMTCWKSH